MKNGNLQQGRQRAFDEINNLIPENPYDLIPKEIRNSQIGLGKIRHKSTKEVAPSPQIRTISPNSFINIPIYLVPSDMLVRINEYNWETFSQQADQDLIIRLFVGNDSVFRSGKIDTPETEPPFSSVLPVQETRIGPTPGIPLDTISSATGVGFPDNYPNILDVSIRFGMAYEKELIFFYVENQSAVFDHAIKLNLRGISFPINKVGEN